MTVSADLLEAKQALSGRLLQAGLRGRVVAMAASLSVSRAVSAAGRNVHAVGIGKKLVEGALTETRCVRIYVVQKLARSLLPPRDVLPTQVDGIPTDIIESPPAFAIARRAAPKKNVKKASAEPLCTLNRRRRQRPVIGGISTAHHEVTAGTLGYFCRSTSHGDDPAQAFVLSNNHVFAEVNQARIGDPLYQPSPSDGGTEADHYADLHRFVQITLGGNVANKVDAALGRLLPGVPHDLTICRIGKITGTAQAVEDMAVRKHGRTSGYTEGTVTDESYDALVGMDHSDPSVVALFDNQMRLEPIHPYPYIGLGGDSGSLVVTKNQANAVGLFFACPPGGSYGIANHLSDVLGELQVELL